MRTTYGSRQEYVDHLGATLGEGYDVQAIATMSGEWGAIKVIDGKRRATAYLVTVGEDELAEIVRRHSLVANEHNFFVATMADFVRCARPEGEPDFVSNSGSAYWYAADGVVRESDHWGAGVASCDWYLDGGSYGYGMHEGGHLERGPVCGFCEWASFERKA